MIVLKSENELNTAIASIAKFFHYYRKQLEFCKFFRGDKQILKIIYWYSNKLKIWNCST